MILAHWLPTAPNAKYGTIASQTQAFRMRAGRIRGKRESGARKGNWLQETGNKTSYRSLLPSTG
jgi:hypothetical protein